MPTGKSEQVRKSDSLQLKTEHEQQQYDGVRHPTREGWKPFWQGCARQKWGCGADSLWFRGASQGMELEVKQSAPEVNS